MADYWHMEWHTEHHAFAGVPCYRLKKLHEMTREYWKRPQSLRQAWHEMNETSERLLAIPPTDVAQGVPRTDT